MRDPVFWKAFRNTVFYIVTIVPLQLALGLLLAVMLNQGLRGKALLPGDLLHARGDHHRRGRSSSGCCLANNDRWLICHRSSGVTGLPIRPPDWLNSTRYAKWAVVMLTLWKNVGFTMVIYLAAFQGVPESLYDAAETDSQPLAALPPRHLAHDQPHDLLPDDPADDRRRSSFSPNPL
ncbi:MAG: ABC transporter permease subunit [Caldilineaceae bacterium]